MIDFGTCLKQFRKSRGESLLTLSNKLGVGVSFLSALESGKKVIPLEYGNKISDALNLTNEESIILKNSIDYSNNRVVFDLSLFNDDKKKFVIDFARLMENSNLDVNEIKKILISKIKDEDGD